MLLPETCLYQFVLKPLHVLSPRSLAASSFGPEAKAGCRGTVYQIHRVGSTPICITGSTVCTYHNRLTTINRQDTD